MTIPTVSKSDKGLYWCEHPQRGESPKSWITVRAETCTSTGPAYSELKQEDDGDGTTSQVVVYAHIDRNRKKLRKSKGPVKAVDVEPVYSEVRPECPTESRKPVVILQPDKQTFRGETVTLRCEIQGEKDTDWEYSWYKKSSSLSLVSKNQTYRISPVNQSHSGEYTCRGKDRRDSQNSEMSDAVTLTVSSESKPKPQLTSSLKGEVLRGHTVTLSCKPDQSTGWEFYWYRHTQNSSALTQTDKDSYTISSVTDSDGGQYWCRAGRGNPVYYTQYSDAVWLNVPALTKHVCDAEEGSSDVTYAQIVMKNMKIKNKDLFSPLPSGVKIFAGYLTSVGMVGIQVYLVAQ
ncbi:basement membrane-specific heparan sulfate proteoglycan core protein-like [Chanos chanos]|uniref:Basement membrane-specific heparan sulfate proteoglycan core protein-like n=1 Tax=Chanos chanos TaxID=29144 RepID=A0A6J2VQH8_CHACN|nr:basement membrane-specific heparan sulfate proteoglycan core protein-like [Chanos chanos]